MSGVKGTPAGGTGPVFGVVEPTVWRYSGIGFNLRIVAVKSVNHLRNQQRAEGNDDRQDRSDYLGQPNLGCESVNGKSKRRPCQDLGWTGAKSVLHHLTSTYRRII